MVTVVKYDEAVTVYTGFLDVEDAMAWANRMFLDDPRWFILDNGFKLEIKEIG